MKTTYLILTLLIGSFLGCKSKVQERNVFQETVDERSGEEVFIEDSNTIDPNVEPDSTIFVDLLSKFYYEDNEYFVPLYFIDEYSESAVKELTNNNVDVIYEDAENRRKKLDELLTKKYLAVNGLNRVVVLNGDQDIIDTLIRKNYEYYEANIESSFVATYNSGSDFDGNIILSMRELGKISFRKSPEVYTDSLYTRKIMNENFFKANEVYSSGHIKYEHDTISFLSFGDYNQGKECLYLLKNGTLTDSVVNDFIISGMIPVPLATETELMYISSVQVPETDIRWNSLTGIDLKSYKFVFYDRNRKKID
ncbi:MAG TPA: hypothetical protein VD884_08340 [Ohtaekwangia sp.]|nr:hypothetical protein [Ohtaekwangia sp.]